MVIIISRYSPLNWDFEQVSKRSQTSPGGKQLRHLWCSGTLSPAQSCPPGTSQSCSKVPWLSVTWLAEVSLSPDFDSWHFGTNRGLSCPSSIFHLSGISGTVHHDTPPIKGSIMSIVCPTGLPSEVALLTKNDIVEDDFYIVIAIWPHHLVNCPWKLLLASQHKTFWEYQPSPWSVSWRIIPIARHSGLPKLITCPLVACLPTKE